MHLKFQPKADPSLAEIQNSKFKIQNSPQAAFTLIEMLVVVFVVGVGLIGVLSFYNINLNSQFETKNEIIAAGLAQEGTELTRNFVEYKRMNPGPGDTWDTIADWFQNECNYIDYNSLTQHKCQTGAYVCVSGGRYSQCSSDPGTGMTRTLTINHIGSGTSNDYLQIEVNVKWNGRTTTAKDIIYENNY